MTKKSKYLLSIILVLMMIVTSVYLPEKPVMASTDSDWANSSQFFLMMWTGKIYLIFE